MLKELRIYLRLRPFIQQLRELPMGKFSTQLVFQIVFVLIGALTTIFDLIPPQYQRPMGAVLVLLSAIYGLYAHYKNPDGTPAAEPWQAKLDQIEKSTGLAG